MLASKAETIHPRWQRTLYILFIAELFTAVGFSSIFPFLPLYVKSLGSSTGLDIEFLAGLVFSGQAVTMMIASPFWGALADRYGRKLMVERAMFGGTVILLMMAFVQNAEQLVILRTIQGLITGTVAAANAMAASIAPRHRMGYAMGLLQVGLGAGVALGPLIGGALADAYGYAAAFYVTSALLFASGLLVWRGAEEHFIPPDPIKVDRISFASRWRHILAAPGVAVSYSLRFLTQFGRSTILPIAPLFIASLLTDQRWLNSFTGLVEGVSAVTTTISAGFLGRLGDRIGHHRILVVSALAGAVIYFFQSRINAAWQLLGLQALVGIALGGIVPAISALLARLTNPDEAGAVYGLDNAISSAGRALAPLLGSSVAIWFGLRAAFTATALLFLLMGLIAALRLPISQAGIQAEASK
jgi:DHA1 family multidrug resistance protein-like MFS transporter